MFEGTRFVYYTLKARSGVCCVAAQKSGWNADFECLEGMLLGYEEWQNDWWITHGSLKIPERNP